jgi:hypothetical protein
MLGVFFWLLGVLEYESRSQELEFCSGWGCDKELGIGWAWWLKEATTITSQHNRDFMITQALIIPLHMAFGFLQ